MENFYLDFNNQSKSKLKLVFGLLMILLSVVNLIYYLNKGEIRTIEIMNLVLLPIVGLFQIFDGSGKIFKDLIGKRFFHLSEKELLVKYRFFESGIKIEWKNLKSICLKYASVEFTKNDDSTEIVSLARLNYQQIKEIKSFIKTIAVKYNIKEINAVS